MANSSPIEPFSRVNPRPLKCLLRLTFVLLLLGLLLVLLVLSIVGVLAVTFVSSE